MNPPSPSLSSSLDPKSSSEDISIPLGCTRLLADVPEGGQSCVRIQARCSSCETFVFSFLLEIFGLVLRCVCGRHKVIVTQYRDEITFRRDFWLRQHTARPGPSRLLSSVFADAPGGGEGIVVHLNSGTIENDS